jgi:hypothetical protein
MSLPSRPNVRLAGSRWFHGALRRGYDRVAQSVMRARRHGISHPI